MVAANAQVRLHRLSIGRAALTGAAVLVVLFVACWAGTSLQGLNVSHMFVSLFTAEPVTSRAALAQGALSSVVFGALTGALVAIFHNLFQRA